MFNRLGKVLVLGLLVVSACSGRLACRSRTEPVPPVSDAAPAVEADAAPLPDACLPGDDGSCLDDSL